MSVVDERSRHKMYLALEAHLGTEEADTMMNLLPPVGWAEVATKSDLLALEDRMSLRFEAGGHRFSSIDQHFDEMNRRFAEIDRRFEQVDRRFEQVDQRFAEVDQRFAEVDQRFAEVDRRFDDVDRRFEELTENMNRRFDSVASKADLQVAMRQLMQTMLVTVVGTMTAFTAVLLTALGMGIAH